MQKTYFLIAPDHFKKNNTRFRRHRIAQGLIQENETKVYWIYPMKSKKWNDTITEEVLENGIICLGIPDYYSLGRYNNITTKYWNELKGMATGKVAIIYTIPMFKNISQLIPVDRIYYDCSDNWTESWLTGKEKFKSKIIERIKIKLVSNEEDRIVEIADQVFVSSIFLKQKVQYKKDVNKIQLIENGVDFSLFNKQNIKDKTVNPSIGYIGGLKNKVDLKLIKLIAERFPNYSVELIGPIDKNTDITDLKNKSNVKIKEPIPLEDVPKKMRELALGIMPYRNISYNKGIVPLKLFEYLAVGVPVISIGLPSIRKFEESGVLKVTDNYDEFLVQAKNLIDQRYNKSLIQKRIQIAEKNDWGKKINLITNFINEDLV